MIGNKFFQLMAEFNAWMNDKVYTACSKVLARSSSKTVKPSSRRFAAKDTILRTPAWSFYRGDVTPFIGPGLMRVGGCGHATAPC
jgi:hypothetical protein